MQIFKKKNKPSADEQPEPFTKPRCFVWPVGGYTKDVAERQLQSQSVSDYYTIVWPEEVDQSLADLPLREIDVAMPNNEVDLFFTPPDDPYSRWMEKVYPQATPTWTQARRGFHKSDRIAMKQDLLPEGDSGDISEKAFRANKEKYNLRIVPEEEANLISSLSGSGMYHYPIIDLDVPHVYVPSSTNGHGHLYLNVAMRYSDYETLLVILERYGIVGQGSVDQLRACGVSLARKPDVKKPCRSCGKVCEGGQVCQFMWQLPHGECMDPQRPIDRKKTNGKAVTAVPANANELW